MLKKNFIEIASLFFNGHIMPEIFSGGAISFYGCSYCILFINCTGDCTVMCKREMYFSPKKSSAKIEKFQKNKWARSSVG